MTSTPPILSSSLPSNLLTNNNNNNNGTNNNNSQSIDLRSSMGGISSGISKISLYSKETNGYILSCDVDRQREINEAELLFQSMPELSYNVTKINQWGKHQKRVLRLTNKGIANVRNEVVSSLYEYADVRAIYLRDSEVFVLEYNGASHNYVYKSSIGYQIVQEITSRLNMRRTTDKKKHGFDIAMEYQKKLKQHDNIDIIVDQASNQNNLTNNNNSSLSSISRSLSFDSSDSSSISSSSSPPSTNVDSTFVDDDTTLSSRPTQQKRATKLSQLLGNTEEQRLQAEIDRVTLAPQSNERKAIQQFMNNFSVLLKNPATVVMIVRQFIDTTKQSILNDRGGQLSKLLLDSGKENDETLNITTIVEKNLEKSILLPIHKKLYGVISLQVQKEETTLQDNINKLANKSQEFFGIKDEFITPNNWKSAVLELSCLDRCEIPHHKLDTILASARAIYNSINHEKNLNNKIKQDYFLSADDFLPIYLYVVVNSGVKDLEFTNQYLWQLCDPDRLGGEGGYYLTVFSSTLCLIRSLKMDDVEKATIIDELIPSIPNFSSSTGTDDSDTEIDSTNNSTNTTSSSSPSPLPSPIQQSSSCSSLPSPTSTSNNNTNTNTIIIKEKEINTSNSNLSLSWSSASISRKDRTQSLSLGDNNNINNNNNNGLSGGSTIGINLGRIAIMNHYEREKDNNNKN